MRNDAAGADNGAPVTRPPAGFPALVATGQSLTSIARELNVSRFAVTKWAAEPECIADVEAIHREALTAMKSRVRHLAAKALDTLEEIMDEEKGQPASRVSAAKEILGRVLPTLQALDVSARVETSTPADLTDDALQARLDALRASRAIPTTTEP